MRVGDVVRQSGKLIQLEGKGFDVNTERLGVVIGVTDRRDRLPAKFAKWGDWLGKSVTVLWSNGKVSESVAENALEVVNSGCAEKIGKS